jgi:hypothetical protein
MRPVLLVLVLVLSSASHAAEPMSLGGAFLDGPYVMSFDEEDPGPWPGDVEEVEEGETIVGVVAPDSEVVLGEAPAADWEALEAAAEMGATAAYYEEPPMSVNPLERSPFEE